MFNWQEFEVEIERRNSEIRTAAAHRRRLDLLFGADRRLARKNRFRNYMGQKLVALGYRLQAQTQEIVQSSEFAAILIADTAVSNPE